MTEGAYSTTQFLDPGRGTSRSRRREGKHEAPRERVPAV